MPATQPASGEEIVVATGADEGYAVPLAVTVRSAIDTLGANQRMRLFVLDGGFKAESRRRLEQSWQDDRVRIEWIEPPLDVIQHLPVTGHASIACYLRILLPQLLPANIEKVLYLDSDLLVRRDLAHLYAEPLGDSLALAIQDMVAPWMDSKLMAPRYAATPTAAEWVHPVANFNELGIRPEAPYFNSGILVFNPAEWRRRRITQQVVSCLESHRELAKCWDQYALNVVLADQWRGLDLRWNQGAQLFVYPTWRESPFDRKTFRLVRRDPWIVHFCSEKKPWHYFNDHPHRRQFYTTLARTEFRDWRPEAPENLIRCHWRNVRHGIKKRIHVAKAIGRDMLGRAA